MAEDEGGYLLDPGPVTTCGPRRQTDASSQQKLFDVDVIRGEDDMYYFLNLPVKLLDSVVLSW